MSYFPYNVVVKDNKHMLRALEITPSLLQTARESKEKPYDYALALYLTLCGLCKEFGWHPQQDFHHWVADEFPEKIVPTLIGTPP